MVEDRTAAAQAPEIPQGWAPAAPGSAGLRRHPVGASQRRSLERFASVIPLTRHLLAKIARLGSARRVVEALASLPGRTRPTRSTHLGRDLRRRLVRTGEKRGDGVGCTRKGKGTKWMVVASGEGVPLGIHLDSAAPAEVKLIGQALDNISVGDRTPIRLIADRGYDSDRFRSEMAERGIEVIVPNRRGRRKTQEVGACDDTAVAGSSSARWRGWATSDASSSATNTTLMSTAASFTLRASSSP